VLKRYWYERDWVMRLTHDDAVREVALYRHGVYGRLPDECMVPIIAAARDGRMWASLMRDVSDALAVAAEQIIAHDIARGWLVHLAKMHIRFGDARPPAAAGLSSLTDFLSILSPGRVRAELEAGRRHPVLEQAERGWGLVSGMAGKDIVDFVSAVHADPGPLGRALDKMPQTLVHGDYKIGNLGAVNEHGRMRTVMLDWQDATWGPPWMDVGYFLFLNAHRLPFSREEALWIYGDELERGGVSAEGEQIDLALVAGGPLRLLWLTAADLEASDAGVRARAEDNLEWWRERMRGVRL
jgi:hypothetical protein